MDDSIPGEMHHESGRPVASGAQEPPPRGYQLSRILGRGGMGEVYLARDLTLGRDVAIKFLLPDRTGDSDARRRLLREAQAAAAVDHPGLCTVYETGETPDGRGYIVMQYVEGHSLSDVLLRGPMPEREALTLCAHIADALHAAHQRGIVHRDLKPGNVIVTPSGRPKILDLGIAKVVSASSSDAPTRSTATTDGVILGTPAYMSPEQVQQRPLDGRSDLFSLGAVLFECLTGRRAFEGASPVETIAKVLHVHPPSPSSLHSGLTERHDELCRRLLAKDPSDRFQSAEEVVGAIRLLTPDSSRNVFDRGELRPRPWRRRIPGLAAAVVLVIAASAWIWGRTAGLPVVPPEADEWYRRGTDAIREGEYFSARLALEEAVSLFPSHVLAYARLAEVSAELDDERAAQEHLLKVSELVPDESRLPEIERLRIQGVRALVLRDVDKAVALYRELVDRRQEPGAWLDLGRVQEAAGLRTAARESYAQAIRLDRQSAAAHLRLGYVEGLASRRDEALAAFREAERLYQLGSDVEGQTEVLLRRGAMQESFGDLKSARADLTRALSLAENAKAVHQQVRIQLGLSVVRASEGAFADSERIAEAAIDQALSNGLETVAAGGLLDVAATLMFAGKLEDASARTRRAIQLADRRGARRTAARARLQLASVLEEMGRPREALTLVDEVRPFLAANRHRRLELLGLSIASRAHERLGDLERARTISSSVLETAEKLKDDAQVALALGNLASVTTALGDYPAALALRERAEALHRRQGDNASLPYDLANRADLLIRLGRTSEADRALSELEKGISAGLEAYVGRTRRAVFLRAMAAATERRCADAAPLLRRLAAEPKARDSSAMLTPAIAAYCDAVERRRGAMRGAMPATSDPAIDRERQYWLAAGALERGDALTALSEARKGLELLGGLSNHELRWRLLAIGAAAAHAAGNRQLSTDMSASAREAYERLGQSWHAGIKPYEQRGDLVVLRKRSGLV